MAMPVASQTFNFIDLENPELVLSTLENSVELKLYYLSSTIAPPAPPTISAPVEAHRFKVGAWSNVRHELDVSHPAFSGGFGAIRIEADAPKLFYGYLLADPGVCVPITAPELLSTLFRVPVMGDPPRVKIAVTNVSAVVSTLEFTIRGARPVVHSAMFGPGVTYLFEPAKLGWSLSAPSAIEIHTGQLSVCSARIARNNHASLLYPLPG